MRKIILSILVCFIASTYANAQSKLIHYWNFNSFTTTMYTPTINAIPADYTDLPGSNSRVLYAEMPGTSSAYSSFIESFVSAGTDYDTVNLRMSATAGNYIRTRNPSDSMELLFYTPSTHFNNLVFTFGTSRPTNGMKYQNYDYSIDSGTSWITTGLSILTDSVWSTFQRITLTTTNAAVNNNPKLVFRVTWTGNTTGTMGNNRFDNVSLDGDSINTAEAVNQNIIATDQYRVYPNPVTDNLNVATSAEGSKKIMIINMMGQKLYEGIEDKKEFSISTSALKAGYYFIRITDNGSGMSETLKFLK